MQHTQALLSLFSRSRSASWRFAPGCEELMALVYGIGASVTLLVLVYLFVALLYPERFQ